MPIGEVFTNLVAGIIGSWLSDMIGAATVIGTLLFYLSRWLRKNRGKAESVSGDLIFSSLAVAGLALLFAAGAYAWQQYSQKQPHSAEKVTALPANPYPKSILTTRYYSKKNKEDIADILDKTNDAFNKQGNDIFAMAETAINGSPWDRPNEDIGPMIDRILRIEALTADLRRDLFEELYKQYPDYRVEINSLIFPYEPPAYFEKGAKNFQNALIVWNEHRGKLEGNQRQEFVQLVNTARGAFAGFRQDFLKWVDDRIEKIAQTRMALKQ
jgi:hypothetical protein